MQVKIKHKTQWDLARERTEKRIQAALCGNLTRRQRLALDLARKTKGFSETLGASTLKVIRKYQIRDARWGYGYAEGLFLAEEQRAAEEQFIRQQHRIWNRIKLVRTSVGSVGRSGRRAGVDRPFMADPLNNTQPSPPRAVARPEIVVDITPEGMKEFWAQQFERDDMPHKAGLIRGKDDVPKSNLEKQVGVNKRKGDQRFERAMKAAKNTWDRSIETV